MEHAIVRSDFEDVEGRLSELGLTRSAFVDAVTQGHVHRAALTRNHPPQYHGSTMWGQTVAALRELLAPLGWFRREPDIYPLTAHEEQCMAIVVAAGDEYTGDRFGDPSTRSQKGRYTVNAVAANATHDMFADYLPKQNETGSGEATWLLLHHTDLAAKEIRIELSRPVDMGGGKVTGWSERILLGSIPIGDDWVEVAPPDVPDIDFEIRRKAS
jgi:hypothetical protein